MAAAAFPISAERLAQRAETCHKELLAARVKLTTPPVSRLELQSIEPTGSKGDRITGARVTFSFTVEPSDCNTWGTIHGGCVFTICNAAGKIATAVVAEGAKNIVSTDLTTNYLAGVPVGSTVQVEIECLRTTKSIGFLRGSIKDAQGTLCYICVQNVSFEL
ncbi:hypothetical protein GGH12_005921 [Coemansia sp. RSA 1822]|nr:hypothetical protein LPJ76_003200 [Coemansia sp. RSA 638]KAJ2120790.1 hypothetical protein IW147_004811 [Coemansia sp. RSA 720]KAJ2541044.1 hypothetical protein GGF49_003963 [Coemansia sp. RSA 1853]KAJ2558299.1 hypothetical protein GGH12_005921 [Coemansia sp. RSA 1822]